ncbi:MAG TPA: hypothetical protein VF483_11770, partial [Gemmatimonadaceae bacterium]
AKRLAPKASWRGWRIGSYAAAVAMVGCIAIYAVWSVRPTGYAGTFERAAMLVPMIWTFAFLRRVSAGIAP